MKKTTHTSNKQRRQGKQRQFLALDGEALYGRYVLLGTQDPSLYLYDPKGLSSREVFEWLLSLRSKRRVRDCTKVMFRMHYDVNLWCRDLDDDVRQGIFTSQEVLIHGYVIKYIPNKIFSLSRAGDGRHALVIYDTYSFFQCTFEKACQKFLGSVDPLIAWGKRTRSRFTKDDFRFGLDYNAHDYNRAECRSLIQMLSKIDGWLDKLKIHISRWHGPSSVANAIMRGYKIKDDLTIYEERKTPVELWEAFRGAFFGGRSEAFKVGSFPATGVHYLDLNSAYAAAMTELPVVDYWWDYTRRFLKAEPMALYHVRWEIPYDAPIGPLPWRGSNGRICFPRTGEGWYYYPEVDYLLKRWPGHCEVLGGWWHPFDKESKLKHVIPRLYRKRQELKAADDPAEFILKIGMSSMSGKFFQRVGYAQYHCLPWAGWITSKTRAQLLEASHGYDGSIIAFTTDCILSTERLPVTEGQGLGRWRYRFWPEGTCLGPGVYWLRSGNEEFKKAERGFVHINWPRVMRMFEKYDKAWITDEIFITFRLARHAPDTYGQKELDFYKRRTFINPLGTKKRSFPPVDSINWSMEHLSSLPPENPANGRTDNPQFSQPYDPDGDNLDAEIIYKPEI